MTVTETGADLLVRELQTRGVPFLPVLCGHGLNPLLAAAERAGLRLVDTHNEQAASYIADAYARLTRRVGVLAVSSGVAHANALAGLLNAHFDGAPVLLITGASDSTGLGRGAFQDFDQVALARPICKFAELVTRPERIPQAVHEAFAAATVGRPGPVHLTIPEDVLGAAIDEVKSPFGQGGEVIQRAAGDKPLIDKAVRLLARAKRPIIVAGSGVFYAHGGNALEQFAKRTRIPVVTPIWDRGAVDRPSDIFLGVVGAATGEPSLLEEADVVLLAGVRVDYRLRYLDTPPLADGVRVIRIDVDPTALYQGVYPQVAILADAHTAFRQLENEWQSGGHAGHDSWLAVARDRHQRFYSRWVAANHAPAEAVTGASLMQALGAVVADDVVFLVDGGSIGQWVHMTLCSERYPAHWLTCGASGAVGWGLPGAIAARLAFPERPVLLLTGDGAIGFGIAELESAVRQKLPFVALVADDQAWGIVAEGQRRILGSAVASELGPIDFVRVAEGFGARAVRIERADQIPSAVHEGFESGWPTLIHVPLAGGGP